MDIKESIRRGLCVSCEKTVRGFDLDVYFVQYNKSGLCQECQIKKYDK